MRKSLLCAILTVTCCAGAFGVSYKVLWSFGGTPSDGNFPISSLIGDSAGNLYGTTPTGGQSAACTGCGTVFKLSPNPDGTWTNTIIHAFCSNFVNNQCADGTAPQAGLVRDAAGNLYGTTQNGGNVFCPPESNGCGTAFELSPNPDGSWTHTVLYNFCQVTDVNGQCLDGSRPRSQLTFDAAGNLYGTANGGSGHIGDGVVFELSPGPSGWTETILYNFCSLGQGNFCPDGAVPTAGVTFDGSGNLYGTTEFSVQANGGGGLVYKLSPGSNGWTETIIHDFKNNKNQNPLGGVTFDSAGNLYTTTSTGFSMWGSVFRSSPSGVVSSFAFNGTNGAQPYAGVVVDSKTGSVYGTTTGNFSGNFGNVFKLGPKSGESVVYAFCSQTNCTDGGDSQAALIEDKAGHLYGTTKLGGAFNQGVVFEIKP